jgi:radical SAM protein with 4Fe4S-binding SPASM domain
VNSALRGDAIIIVSLDGSCEEVHRILRGPNHFAQTESFAAALIDAGLNVHFNYVVHSGNLHDVSDFVTFAERIGANQVNFLPLVPKGYGLDLGEHSRPDPEKLHSLLSRLYCEGSEQRRRLLAGNYAHILDLERQGVQTANECVAGYKGLFYITPEGDVYSCPNLVGTSLRVGNYLETPLVELHDRGLDQLYRSRLHNPDLDERYLCRGERMSQSEARPSRLRSLPLLSAGAENRGYPDAARRLQEILLREGKATPSSGHGTSYCFSRNF